MNEKSNKTAVEWLIEQLIFKQEYEHLPNNYFLMSDKDIDKIIEQAKEMECEQMATNCSQLYKPTMIFGEHKIHMLEIDDEEIKEVAYRYKEDELEDTWEAGISFMDGAKWYREQLKKKQ